MSSDNLAIALKAADQSELILDIFGFICTFIFLVIYIVFFYKLRQSEGSSNASKRNKIVTNPWIMILPTTYTMCYTIRYLLKLISNVTNDVNVFYQVSFDATFIIGNALFYVIMLLRLALGFKGTVYELTRVKLVVCCIILICITLINIFHYVIKRHEVGNETIDHWNDDEVHNNLFVALVCCNLVFAMFLIYLFVRN
eukprot:420303_1